MMRNVGINCLSVKFIFLLMFGKNININDRNKHPPIINSPNLKP